MEQYSKVLPILLSKTSKNLTDPKLLVPNVKIRLVYPRFLFRIYFPDCVCLWSHSDPQCGANSTYSFLMTSCPASCADLAAPSDCEQTELVEGCQCGSGFVLSDQDCVPYSQCGCTYLDRYYPVRLLMHDTTG